MSTDSVFITEMKDGFTSSARVKELVNAMLAERDSVSKIDVYVTRQWSTIASTIAATEDKECLDLFVQLDGVSFINKWLEDARKLGNEPSDSSAEESIHALLLAVEKLGISYEQTLAYGIRVTVEKLLSYNSVRVQEKAKALFDSWKQSGDGDAITSIGGEGGQTMSSTTNNSTSVEGTQEETHSKTGDDMANMSANGVLIAKIDDIEPQLDNEEKALHNDNMKDGDSTRNKPSEESLCYAGENSPRHLEGDASNSTSIAVVPKEDEMVSNNQSSGDKEHKQEVAIPLEILDAMEISPFFMLKDSEPVAQTDLQNNTVTEVDNNLKELAMDNNRMDTLSSSSQANRLIKVDGAPPDQNETMAVSPNLSKDCDTNVLRGSQILENSEKSTSSGDSDSFNDADFFKTIKEDYDVVKNRSGLDFSYGICDALKVARQVANEVEKEVEGQIEESGSDSSQENLVEPREPDSPASVHGNETQTNEGSSREDLPKVGEGSKDENVSIVEQESQGKSDKEINIFDLNEDICFDDMDQNIDTLPTPVSIVSASRATAAPGFPESPLQFEGSHGWKGSAATSAFRAASPRKIHDSDKFDNNLNNRQNFLDFDLNMSEEGDNKAMDLLSHKQNLHSAESSGEAKISLDLNRTSDEDDPQPSDWRLSERLLLSKNGHHNASPSTSSSSMQQPSRNFFDLNDQPSLFNGSSEVNLKPDSQKLHSFLGPGSSNNVISIMGTKVEVNRKDFSPHPPFLPNGKILEPATGANLARNGGISGIRSALPYPHPGMFMYSSGLTSGPPGPFSPVMYGPSGPIPYMVDSRGAPVAPQFLGSAPYSQTPFSSSGNYPGLYGPGPGPSRPTFELNLGLMGERINRESGGLRQFLGPGPNQSLDDFRSNGFGKRKEPDGGWEPYQFDYKHQHPQWR